jgi:hypothetical protein
MGVPNRRHPRANSGDSLAAVPQGPDVTASPLTKIEQAILQILNIDPRHEIFGRDMRSMLRSRGFRRSAPALVFTMLSLEDKGLVDCREETRIVNGVTIKDRYYRAVATRGD